MAEIFLGDLSEVKIFDVLKPLLMGKKTGRLSFRGEENGDIYLESGNIIHAKTSNYSGEYGFFAIMGWKAGRITFEPSETPSEKSIQIPSEQLLLYWSSKKMDWEKIRQVIPSNNTTFRLSVQRDGENKTITSDQWNVLALSNGVRTISDIAKTLNWDELKTISSIYPLFQAGLLERVEAQKLPNTNKKVVGENFFVIVENELKKAIGPVAPIIIEDKLSELGETKDSLPQDQALSFIESLEEEIPGDPKRKEFIKAMMDSFYLLE
jgi:Domain of unknown function (DUF4388)